MTFRFASLARLSLAVLVILAILATPRPALAALGITGVQPGTVSNSVSTNLAITGADFVSNTLVLLDGYGALATTYVAPNLLTALLPAGAPTGAYTVRVLNPDGTSAALSNALTVTGPTATPGPTAFTRPLIVVVSYGASVTQIVAGENLDFEMTVQNAGQDTATNVVASFESGDFLPRETGGIRSVGTLTPGQSARFFQPLYAIRDTANKRVATLNVKVAYTTASGATYNNSFALTFDVLQPSTNNVPATATPTPTARPNLRPLLVVSAYRSDVAVLQPGVRFTLEMDVLNVGNAKAQKVTLIVGGGTAGGGSSGGTPQPGGGVSGGSGEFTNFAPVNSSNVQALGDIEGSVPITAKQTFIVNATTKPGAYPLKLSFIYVDERGNSFTDDQVVTLLVYQIPQIAVSFYQDPGVLFSGQGNALPLQVANLGRNTALLGTIKVTAPEAPDAQFSNNSILIGNLDPGGTFPLDAQVVVLQPGVLNLLITVEYTDDFNQPQQITSTLTLEVLENIPPPIDPGNGDGGIIEPPPAEETMLDSILRFLRALFGLDSAPPSNNNLVPVPGFDPGLDPGTEPRPLPAPAVGPKG